MLKRFILGAGALLAFVVPAPAFANQHIPRGLAAHYQREYQQVVHRYGKRAPGRNIVKWGLATRPARAGDVHHSLAVLGRMLAPPPKPVIARVASRPAYTASTTSTATSTAVSTSSTTYAAPASTGYTPAPSGGLEACIIQHESGGNPQATNGQYGGIGQWSPSAWASDGGTRYASSPQGASYAQQQAVLSGEGAAGMASQQGQYDGCS